MKITFTSLGVAVTPETDMAAENRKQLHMALHSSHITKCSVHFHFSEHMQINEVQL